ncbi:rCG26979 [Rattus norvegicus]|uniref:RCG26979 n=1 Tax=Rattus norvegicus TaxID=10116 RepID=A6HP84_RAT|nr:rCG26979 [Rattus norvegicus]
MKKRNSGQDRRLGMSLSGRLPLAHMRFWVQPLELKETINTETKRGETGVTILDFLFCYKTKKKYYEILLSF